MEIVEHWTGKPETDLVFARRASLASGSTGESDKGGVRDHTIYERQSFYQMCLDLFSCNKCSSKRAIVGQIDPELKRVSAKKTNKNG